VDFDQGFSGETGGVESGGDNGNDGFWIHTPLMR
jgi:hypothetical protein